MNCYRIQSQKVSKAIQQNGKKFGGSLGLNPNDELVTILHTGEETGRDAANFTSPECSG